MEKQFCTAGPIQPDLNYAIPAAKRLDMQAMLTLIEGRKYFILHAPRQTGKTTCLRALVKELNATGKYRAVYINVEAAQTARNDVDSAVRSVLSVLGDQVQMTLQDGFPDSIWPGVLDRSGGSVALQKVLAGWAANDPKPVVLMIDEIDALSGDSLISILRQLRSGYPERPERFPQCIILCGLRDIRDYRIHGKNEIITGGSAFNIKAESLRLGDFTQGDVRDLYEQHTAETGQRFDEAVYPLIWELTRGQPWLVNALAYEACFRMRENYHDRSRAITAEIVQEAKERLIQGRETHLDQLADKLKEDRVRRVIQPMLAGDDRVASSESSDDTQYVIDLGLIRRSPNGLEISNAIYSEVIPRELNFEIQTDFGNYHRQEWYIGPDGRLLMDKLLDAFQQFYRENSEIWLGRFSYTEAAHQLLLQAFLQRVVNGGGRIEREYGLGRRRTDLLILWKHPAGVQRIVIELKMLYRALEQTLEIGLAQTAEYLDRVGLGEGHLVIFDRDTAKPWEQKVYRLERESGGRRITVWGM